MRLVEFASVVYGPHCSAGHLQGIDDELDADVVGRPINMGQPISSAT